MFFMIFILFSFQSLNIICKNKESLVIDYYENSDFVKKSYYLIFSLNYSFDSSENEKNKTSKLEFDRFLVSKLRDFIDKNIPFFDDETEMEVSDENKVSDETEMEISEENKSESAKQEKEKNIHEITQTKLSKSLIDRRTDTIIDFLEGLDQLFDYLDYSDSDFILYKYYKSVFNIIKSNKIQEIGFLSIHSRINFVLKNFNKFISDDFHKDFKFYDNEIKKYYISIISENLEFVETLNLDSEVLSKLKHEKLLNSVNLSVINFFDIRSIEFISESMKNDKMSLPNIKMFNIRLLYNDFKKLATYLNANPIFSKVEYLRCEEMKINIDTYFLKPENFLNLKSLNINTDSDILNFLNFKSSSSDTDTDQNTGTTVEPLKNLIEFYFYIYDERKIQGLASVLNNLKDLKVLHLIFPKKVDEKILEEMKKVRHIKYLFIKCQNIDDEIKFTLLKNKNFDYVIFIEKDENENEYIYDFNPIIHKKFDGSELPVDYEIFNLEFYDDITRISLRNLNFDNKLLKTFLKRFEFKEINIFNSEIPDLSVFKSVYIEKIIFSDNEIKCNDINVMTEIKFKKIIIKNKLIPKLKLSAKEILFENIRCSSYEIEDFLKTCSDVEKLTIRDIGVDINALKMILDNYNGKITHLTFRIMETFVLDLLSSFESVNNLEEIVVEEYDNEEEFCCFLLNNELKKTYYLIYGDTLLLSFD